MAGLGDYVAIDATDIAAGWHTLTDDQVTAVETLIERAMPILLVQSPGLLDRLASGTTPPEAVEQVLIQAVRRAATPMFNPVGAKRVSMSIDDYTEATEYDTVAMAAGLYFTNPELSLLASGVKARRGRAFTIDTTPRY